MCKQATSTEVRVSYSIYKYKESISIVEDISSLSATLTRSFVISPGQSYKSSGFTGMIASSLCRDTSMSECMHDMRSSKM